MNKEIVPYEEALTLSQIGFVQSCWHAYHDLTWPSKEDEHKLETVHNLTSYTEPYTHKYINPVLAPTFSQAFRWFRENHGLYSCIMYSSDGIIKGGYSPMIDVMKPHKATLDLNTYDIYEEAELACLRRLIEIVKTV